MTPSDGPSSGAGDSEVLGVKDSEIPVAVKEAKRLKGFRGLLCWIGLAVTTEYPWTRTYLRALIGESVVLEIEA